jgi:hypothetical protein
MQGIYSLITVGVVMVFYISDMLLFFMDALMVRLVPTPIRIPSENRSRQRTLPRPR